MKRTEPNRLTLPTKPVPGLWALLEGLRGAFLFSLLMQGLSVLAEVAGTLIIRRFVDGVLVPRNWTEPPALYAGAFFAVALLRGSSSFLSGRWSAHASEMAVRKVRDMLFDHVQRLTFAYHDRTQTGELIQRSTSDVDTVRRFYADHVKGMARILFLFAVNFTTILLLRWQLALLSVAAVPFMAAASVFFFGRIHKAYDAYQEQDGKLSAVLQENLTGVRVVRAFARQEFEETKFETENGGKLRLGFRFLLTHAVYWPVSEFIGGIQMVGCVVGGGLMAMNGTITLGTFVAYIGLATGIIWPLQQLGRLIAQLSTTTVSYERIRTVLAERREDLDRGYDGGRRRLRGDVTFEKVSFAYEKDNRVLREVSLEAPSGTKVALLGEPGSGKTTLVNLLPRFYDCASGTILVDGRPLEEYSRRYLRANIGIVEQQPFLFSTDIRSNITYGVSREVTQEEVEEAARAAAIHEAVVSFPRGYDTVVGERGVTLSGGQKQRIAIARTLLKDPAVLILDDSTSSVDAETEDEIRRALDRLAAGRTTFIIAHRIQSLMKADLILVFKEGRIIQRGAHDDLIARPGFYAEVFELQTRIESELRKETTHG